MKKIITLLCIVACFAACTDESTTPNSSNNSSTTSDGVIGVWNLADLIEEDGKVTENGELMSTYSSTSSNQNGTVEFKSDGTSISKIGYDLQTTQTMNGETSVDNAIVAPVTGLGEYTYNSTTKEMSTTLNGVTSTGSVLELTANTMVLVLNVRSEQEVDGKTVVTSHKTTSTYTK
jgi:hypothetical protein